MIIFKYIYNRCNKGVIQMVLASFVFLILTYVLMIFVNGLANQMPLNGITTGDVSYKYPNLFQPAGVTFAIWGLIYLGLFVFILYQGAQLKQLDEITSKRLFININLLFSLIAILNMCWLFLWHYDRIALSTIVMVGLLITLIVTFKIIDKDVLFIRSVVSLYLGWISVALIANFTILLVKIGTPNLGNIAVSLTIIMIFIGGLITLLWTYKEKEYVFSFVILWAYLGILLRHFRKENLDQTYPMIQLSVLIMMISIISFDLFVVFKK
ncbi:conserved hypothetical protein [Paracholeplasma brassicae]|uniref:Uncharacterized protein n=2 Tax=Acholeplasma brassicae TaxID=61635 RepID=U4KP67_9MOLU|nr:conserved hypothetical protein [Paracholeplasma brassicae]